jgi:hypothetical protein
MTVELLPGAKLTPAVHLHQLLEGAATLKAVLVVTLDADDTMQVTWSNMPVAHLAMAAIAVDAKVRATVLNEVAPDGC